MRRVLVAAGATWTRFRVRSTRRPPCGIASRALVARLISNCQISAGWARTGHRSGASSTCKATFGPMARVISDWAPRSTALTLTIAGVRGRLACSSRATSWLPWRTASFTSSRSTSAGASGGSCKQACSTQPSTIVSRLLKSWMTPLVTWPSRSISARTGSRSISAAEGPRSGLGRSASCIGALIEVGWSAATSCRTVATGENRVLKNDLRKLFDGPRPGGICRRS